MRYDVIVIGGSVYLGLADPGSSGIGQRDEQDVNPVQFRNPLSGGGQMHRPGCAGQTNLTGSGVKVQHLHKQPAHRRRPLRRGGGKHPADSLLNLNSIVPVQNRHTLPSRVLFTDYIII